MARSRAITAPASGHAAAPCRRSAVRVAGASYVVLSAVGRARNDARKLMSGSGAHENLNTFATVSLGAGVRETILQHIRLHPDRDVGGALVGRRTGTSIEIAA